MAMRVGNPHRQRHRQPRRTRRHQRRRHPRAACGRRGEVADTRSSLTSAIDIAAKLREWCDGGDIDLMLTTGGTGLAARDVTPEATLDVAERLAPGIAEAMRAAGLEAHSEAMLSRAVAVVRGRTLIVNLPGSEKGVRESLGAILQVLPHAVDLLRGQTEAPEARTSAC